MNPLINLKRTAPVAFDQCIICQDLKREALFDATLQGLASVREATSARNKLRDVTYKEKIERLQRRLESTTSSVPISDIPLARFSSLRSSVKPMNWKLCIFCQDNQNKQRTCAVSSKNTSNQILSAAKFVGAVSVRVAGINDLIAAEGCYHPNCLKQFLRDSSKAADENMNVDLAMIWLCQELKQSAVNGHVLELDKVWIRYKELANEVGIEIPRSFISRLSTFKSKISTLVKNDYEFIVFRDQAAPDRQTILVPIKFSHIPFSDLVANDENTCEESTKIPVFKSKNGDEFLAMIHVALKLRSDILSHPSYKGLDVSEEATIECIPDSVYMFLRLLLGGQSLFEADPDEQNVQDKEELNKRLRVLSIAQDLVYSVSGGKKLTPKHVGLGSTLHQATRSKQLVNLFHSAGHTVSYRDILKIDTALA